MYALKPNSVPTLDDWGTVANLGSTILEGEGKASGLFTMGTPEAPLSAAFFAVSKSKFRMVYPFTEHAVVVEGEATLTNEATGEAVTYKAGDGWTVDKGTPLLWDVKSPRFVKHYMAVS
jgi:uncharacterized cupin superfamily protein